jgi:hypothetical protein
VRENRSTISFENSRGGFRGINFEYLERFLNGRDYKNSESIECIKWIPFNWEIKVSVAHPCSESERGLFFAQVNAKQNKEPRFWLKTMVHDEILPERVDWLRSVNFHLTRT